MRFRAGSFGPILVVSVIAAVLVALLGAAVAQPIDQECFDNCDIGQFLAMGAIVLVSWVWLAAVLALAWRLRRREPAVAAVSAIAAALFVAVMAGFDTSLSVSPSSLRLADLRLRPADPRPRDGRPAPGDLATGGLRSSGRRRRTGGVRRGPGDACRRRRDCRAGHDPVQLRSAGAVRRVPRLRRGSRDPGLRVLAPGRSGAPRARRSLAEQHSSMRSSAAYYEISPLDSTAILLRCHPDHGDRLAVDRLGLAAHAGAPRVVIWPRTSSARSPDMGHPKRLTVRAPEPRSYLCPSSATSAPSWPRIRAVAPQTWRPSIR